MTMTRLFKRTTACAAVALSTFAAALPAAAGPIDWASWSDISQNVIGGAASAAFGASGITATYSGEVRNFFPNYPSYGPTGTFNGGVIDNAPPTANGIIQIFGGGDSGVNTLTFSQAVLNPVMAIWSLGQGGINAEFAFDTAFTIESGGPSAEFGGVSITSAGNTVFGSEGNGTIQFAGSVTSISWTNPVTENWYGFTVGTSVQAIPEPETYALMLAGLAAVGFVARRRAAA